MFSMQSVSQNPLIAVFQLSSAASLNLGQFQNGHGIRELVNPKEKQEIYYLASPSTKKS